MSSSSSQFRPAGRNLIPFLLKFAICWYVAMCLLHYFSQRPLWNDEQCVFLSIEYFSPVDMYTKTLLALQVFPRTYLFVIQQFAKLFDLHLLSLRFPSFVCMMLAFWIWMKIARREFSDPRKLLLFVISWCASETMIYYSAELKQYSMDVFAAAVLIWFLMHQVEWQEQMRRSAFILMLVVLAALGLFSYMAFAFMPLIFYNLAISLKKDRSLMVSMGIFVLTLLAVSWVVYFCDMRLVSDVLHTPVGYGDYFIMFTSAEEFFKTFGEGVKSLFSKYYVIRPRIFNYISVFFAVPAVVYMFIRFFREFRWGRPVNSLDRMALLLFGELVLLGALQVYPFTVPRLSLFYAPVVLYLTIQGIESMRFIHKWLYYVYRTAFITYLFVCVSGLAKVLILKGHLGILTYIWS